MLYHFRKASASVKLHKTKPYIYTYIYIDACMSYVGTLGGRWRGCRLALVLFHPQFLQRENDSLIDEVKVKAKAKKIKRINMSPTQANS
jgi:hypothetical protein